MMIEVDAVKRILLERPDLFAKHILGVKYLYDKQIEILFSVRDNRSTYVQSCNNSGKTFVSAIIALWFLFCHHPSKVITTSAIKTQIRKTVWSEIRTLWLNSRVKLANIKPSSTEIQLADNHFAIGIRPADYTTEGFQSYHSPNILIIFDEATAIAKPLWESADTILSSENSKFLAIANPISIDNQFYRNVKTGAGNVITISAFDTPNVKAGKNIVPGLMSYDWYKQMELKHGIESEFYITRVLGEFYEYSSSDEPQLIPDELGEEVIRRIPDDKITKNKIIMGVDVSGFGESYNAWVIRQGLNIIYIGKIRTDTDENIANTTLELIRKYVVDEVYFDGSWGKGIFEKVKAEFDKTYLIHMSSAAEDEESFKNLRAECAIRLRNACNKGLCLMGEARKYSSEWKQQVCIPKVMSDERGRKFLETKYRIMKRTGNSPDLFDATLLTFITDYEAERRKFKTPKPYCEFEVKLDVIEKERPIFRKSVPILFDYPKKRIPS